MKEISPGTYLSSDVTHFGDDNAIKVRILGQGPETGNIATSHNYRGFVRGIVSDDIDDGTSLAVEDPKQPPFPQNSTDLDSDDVKFDRQVTLGITTLTLIDGKEGECSWSPDPVKISTQSGTAKLDGIETNDIQPVSVSGVISPLLQFEGLASTQASAATTELSLTWANVGVSFATKKPVVTSKADQHMNWTMDVVKREKDKYADPQECWVYHTEVTLKLEPKSAN